MDIIVHRSRFGTAVVRALKNEDDLPPALRGNNVVESDEEDDLRACDYGPSYPTEDYEYRYGDAGFGDLPMLAGFRKSSKILSDRQLRLHKKFRTERGGDKLSPMQTARQLKRIHGQQPREHFASRDSIRRGMRHVVSDYEPTPAHTDECDCVLCLYFEEQEMWYLFDEREDDLYDWSSEHFDDVYHFYGMQPDPHGWGREMPWPMERPFPLYDVPTDDFDELLESALPYDEEDEIVTTDCFGILDDEDEHPLFI